MAERPPLLALFDYAQVANQWPDAIVVFDHEDRRCLYVNSAAERLVGYGRDEILALDLGDIAHPDDVRRIPDLLEEAQRSGWIRRPWRVRHKDGRLVDTEMTLTPQCLEGRVVGQGMLRVMPVHRSAPPTISRTQGAEAVDVRDADRLQILEQTGLAVVIIDQVGIITYWNAGAAELYGWPADEVMGRQVLDLAPNDESRADVKGLMGPPQGRDEWVTQLSIRPREGEQFQAMVTCSAIRDDHGELSGFLFVTAPLETAARTSTPRMRRARVQCAACGREVAGTMRRKYCSEKCRQWAYYHRNLEAQRERSRQRHERQRVPSEQAVPTDAADGSDGAVPSPVAP